MAADRCTLSLVNQHHTSGGGFASGLLELYGEAMDQALGIEKSSLTAMAELNSCAADTCERLAGDFEDGLRRFCLLHASPAELAYPDVRGNHGPVGCCRSGGRACRREGEFSSGISRIAGPQQYGCCDGRRQRESEAREGAEKCEDGRSRRARPACRDAGAPYGRGDRRDGCVTRPTLGLFRQLAIHEERPGSLSASRQTFCVHAIRMSQRWKARRP